MVLTTQKRMHFSLMFERIITIKKYYYFLGADEVE